MEAADKDEDFRSPLCSIKEKISDMLLVIRHMGYEQQFKHIVDNDVDPRSVLAKWKSKYRDLYDAGKWGPANNAKD